jgi:hypothetical protein
MRHLAGWPSANWTGVLRPKRRGNCAELARQQPGTSNEPGGHNRADFKKED